MIPTFAAAFGSTPLYNEATGGTITTFSGGGKNYKRHTFTGSGSKTLTVVRSPNLFTLMVLGAGGGGSGGYIAGVGVGGAAGGGGGAFEGTVTLAVGANTGTVGAGGAGGIPAAPAGGIRVVQQRLPVKLVAVVVVEVRNIPVVVHRVRVMHLQVQVVLVDLSRRQTIQTTILLQRSPVKHYATLTV
jgi:hypothetical protein